LRHDQLYSACFHRQFYVQDERYAAGAWMRRSGDVQDERYAAGAWIPKAFATLTGQALRRNDDVQDERVVNCLYRDDSLYPIESAGMELQIGNLP
jgi:hypothetical protein